MKTMMRVIWFEAKFQIKKTGLIVGQINRDLKMETEKVAENKNSGEKNKKIVL